VTQAPSQTRTPPATPVILKDGTTAWLRPVHPDDLERLRDLFGRASRESLWFRFFTPVRRVDQRYVERLVRVDGVERVTFVVARGEGVDEQILGVGGYVRLPRWDTAEVAFFVDDAHQGTGIGTILLEGLAAYARRQGILTLVADVMSENHRMMHVFRNSGLKLHIESEQGTLRVELPATPDETALARAEAREHTATVASLDPFFKPRAVAVIGASRTPQTIGNMVLDRLLRSSFTGPVYPVNPHAHSVNAVRAYASVLEVPDEVDLAVIAVPQARVPQVVDECIQKRVRALVVLTAGYAETGPQGRAQQDELLRTVRAHGMRMIGPNCMGILNTAPDVRLNATFGPVLPRVGRVAMSSQSGALGLAILAEAESLGLGISMFVSVGNKADVSGNDLLQYWEQDPQTDLIVLYLESFGNPRKFARIARRIARQKPILAVKSGRSAAGTRAAKSHTAALASSDRAVDALFTQAGVIRADTLEELFDVASVLTSQPLPSGNRVAVVTNAGGPGILCADACEANGLVLPEPAPETVAELRTVLPLTAGLANPIDMIANAGPVEYEATVQRVLRDATFDSVIVIYTPAGMATDDTVAAAIRRGIDAAQTTGHEKPVLACIISGRGRPEVLEAGVLDDKPSRAIPYFRFPESAAKALARTAQYGRWRNQPLGHVPVLPGVDARAARAVVEGALQTRGDAWLAPDEVVRLLAAAGIALPPSRLVPTPEEAAMAAAEIGFPVATKIVSQALTHKSDVGGVALGLASPAEVRSACERMQAAMPPGADLAGFLVQQMVEGGVETIVGVVDDPSFGPLVGFGLGGTTVEVLNDVALRITPLTDTDAREMVHSIRGLPLLQGYRGRPPADLEALEELLLRISWLVEEVPQVAEMDLNPVKVFEPGRGLAPVDVRIAVRPA
jgi:acetyl coenzyme A synthetase (ADP forming)-like protein